MSIFSGIPSFPHDIQDGDRRIRVARLEERAAVAVHIDQAPREVAVLPGFSTTQPALEGRATVSEWRSDPKGILLAGVEGALQAIDGWELATQKDLALWRGNQ